MIYLKYFWRLLVHKWYVLVAGVKIVKGIPLWRLLVHDLSKFSWSEFPKYARNFNGDYSKSPNDRKKVTEEFVFAWLHHENHNKHHAGYWIPRSGAKKWESLEMPEVFIKEMAADILGASMAYTGSFDITEWVLEGGLKKITNLMSPETIVKLNAILKPWIIMDGQ